jgi:hypothetical protein
MALGSYSAFCGERGQRFQIVLRPGDAVYLDSWTTASRLLDVGQRAGRRF